MKAVVYEEFGGPEVLKLTEIEKPIPKDDEILIKICASTVNYGDALARNFKNVTTAKFNMPALMVTMARLFFGFKKPKINILGAEVAGTVEEVGKNVTRFQKGDEVFAYCGMYMGGYAGYICISQKSVVAKKPSNMNFKEAASIAYGANVALPALDRVEIKPGQKVLINGASGSIGSIALQLAKSRGAEVTGVCGGAKQKFVKFLGADHVLDYTKEDFTRNGEKYDLIVDILGRSSFSRCKNSLTSEGTYMAISFKSRAIFDMLLSKITGSKRKAICALTSENIAHLEKIKELAQAGKIKTRIDHSFSFEEAAKAHELFESGKATGKIVLVPGE